MAIPDFEPEPEPDIPTAGSKPASNDPNHNHNHDQSQSQTQFFTTEPDSIDPLTNTREELDITHSVIIKNGDVQPNDSESGIGGRQRHRHRLNRPIRSSSGPAYGYTGKPSFNGGDGDNHLNILNGNNANANHLNAGRGGGGGGGNNDVVMQMTPGSFAITRPNLLDPPRRTATMAQILTPSKKLAPDPTWSTSIKNTVFCECSSDTSTYIFIKSYICHTIRPDIFFLSDSFLIASWFNLLLIFVPISWILHFTKQNDVAIFVVSFVAAIPLAGLLSFATEQLALRVGESLGGLLNATFG